MPRRLNPVTIEEAIEALQVIHWHLKLLLRRNLGPNTKTELESMNHILVVLLQRHSGKRL